MRTVQSLEERCVMLEQALLDLSNQVERHIEHGGGARTWLPDWACRECRPDSDMLVDGFQCGRHKALAIIAAGEGGG